MLNATVVQVWGPITVPQLEQLADALVADGWHSVAPDGALQAPATRVTLRNAIRDRQPLRVQVLLVAPVTRFVRLCRTLGVGFWVHAESSPWAHVYGTLAPGGREVGPYRVDDEGELLIPLDALMTKPFTSSPADWLAHHFPHPIIGALTWSADP